MIFQIIYSGDVDIIKAIQERWGVQSVKKWQIGQEVIYDR